MTVVLLSSLDVKLGLRMLVKHPALTFVGGLGMAVAIAVSVGFFSMVDNYIYPDLPLEEGDRIVALENRDVEIDNEERRALHDFLVWREELRTVEDLGAFRTVQRNLVSGDGLPQLVPVAEMTASGFRVARVAPAMGRYLTEEDERPGAAPVVVLGWDVWQDRFGGDPTIVGRDIRFGATPHTVVGVMPEGFAFPENHAFWTPLDLDVGGMQRREGPGIYVFGRLAEGVEMRQAQAELEAFGARAAAAYPETHAQLRPMVMPYTHSLTDIQGMSLWQVGQMQSMMTLLLLVVALNVAVLVYARTAMRQSEIAVRSALGASRRRVVTQLFVEALVLSLLAAGAGLALAQVGVELGYGILTAEYDAGLPFWFDQGLRPATVVFAVGLAVLSAVIVGVLPGLQATGKRLQADLRRMGGGTSGGLGTTWNVLIVAQVAIAVAALPAALHMGWTEIRAAATRPTYDAEAFVTAGLSPEPSVGEGADAGAGAVPFDVQLAEVLRRVEAEPAVAGATYRTILPGRGGRVEVEGVASPSAGAEGHAVQSLGVEPGYAELFELDVVAGRPLDRSDLSGEARTVLVDEAFVRHVLGGGSAVGRRVRHLNGEIDEDLPAAGEAPPAETGPWLEIVGVVEDLSVNRADPERVRPGLFYPVGVEEVTGASLAVRLQGTTPDDFGPRLRQIVASVDPTLRLGQVRSLAEGDRQRQLAARLVGLAVGLVLVSVLLLSAAGIYALMSFTVTRREREIGIRTALGAPPGQVIRSIFSRAARQILLGIVVGVAVAAALEVASGGEMMGGLGFVLLPALALTMVVVGLLAAVGPALRGLRIEPTEALRAEG